MIAARSLLRRGLWLAGCGAFLGWWWSQRWGTWVGGRRLVGGVGAEHAPDFYESVLDGARDRWRHVRYETGFLGRLARPGDRHDRCRGLESKMAYRRLYAGR